MARSDALRVVVRFLQDLRRGARDHGVAYPAAVARALRLYSIGKFSRDEIVRYGLFVPEIAASVPRLISKERSLTALNSINRPEHQATTEEKDKFQLFCREHRLPVPECLGWTRSGRYFDGNGETLADARSWLEHLAAHAAPDFVAKHRAGAYGSGFCAFRRLGSAYQRLDTGETLDWSNLTSSLHQVSGGGDVIIQERLFDSAAISRLCGRAGLQTMRVNTWLEPSGRVSVLFYMIKVRVGESIADNFSLGRTGNLIAFGDRDEGTLRGALTVRSSGSGMQFLTEHPETGIKFDGFRIPGWRDAIELACRSQTLLPQLPSLGWDIALTETGPRIIEANARWDPPLYAPFLMSANDWHRVFDLREARDCA
jgi:hypothetical protein